MNKKALHITNDSTLTKLIKALGITGDILIWQEILCEGPVISTVGSDDFLDMRSKFLRTFYDIDFDIREFNEEIDKLNHPENYSEIVLWFDYDLFCHVNMLGVISLIQQKKIKLPIYHVCSGRVKGEKNLKELSELSSGQLLNHYESKTRLTPEDIQLCVTLWQTYCGKDHNLFKPYIVKDSSFKYMSNCLKAHLERFPNSKTGLSVLEANILEIINQQSIKTRNQLLGYALNFQGYYGFREMQFIRMIEKLSLFFSENAEGIKLNRMGHEALLGQHDFSSQLHGDMVFGGVKKYDFKFSKRLNKLVETLK
ncbi:DUF1835 domain-containing protein [Mariniflexile ostreae]|uniref:DUF1835 domain-containing protein n=1 Tax=Mariniflexile ostreae TaxID=1520892 RepID=A0ABV5FDV6_9FLAO